MHKTALAALVAALVPQITAAHVVRHKSIPEGYWGKWAPGAGPCKDGDPSAMVLSANAYVGPAGRCTVDFVSETPSARGATYSVRLQCSNQGAQAQKKTVVNLIIRDGATQLAAGPDFNSLRSYHRCSPTQPSAKQ
jgi:hypothetical protein